MDWLKHPGADALVVLACMVTFWLANSASAFSAILNHLFPCAQDPSESFPCYGSVDVVIMILSVVIGTVFLVMTLWNAYQQFAR